MEDFSENLSLLGKKSDTINICDNKNQDNQINENKAINRHYQLDESIIAIA